MIMPEIPGINICAFPSGVAKGDTRTRRSSKRYAICSRHNRSKSDCRHRRRHSQYTPRGRKEGPL